MTTEFDDKLRTRLHSRWGTRRLRGVRQLKDVPASDAVPALSYLLRDRSGYVADAAAEMLLEHFGEAGYAALLRALEWDHAWGRLTAARCLAFAQEPRALLALEAALKDPDRDQWGPAIDRMVLFGQAARPILERELLDEESGSPVLQEMCAGALAEVAGDDARPALEQAVSSRNQFVRRAARQALAMLDQWAGAGSG